MEYHYDKKNQHCTREYVGGEALFRISKNVRKGPTWDLGPKIEH